MCVSDNGVVNDTERRNICLLGIGKYYCRNVEHGAYRTRVPYI